MKFRKERKADPAPRLRHIRMHELGRALFEASDAQYLNTTDGATLNDRMFGAMHGKAAQLLVLIAALSGSIVKLKGGEAIMRVVPTKGRGHIGSVLRRASIAAASVASMNYGALGLLCLPVFFGAMFTTYFTQPFGACWGWRHKIPNRNALRRDGAKNTLEVLAAYATNREELVQAFTALDRHADRTSTRVVVYADKMDEQTFLGERGYKPAAGANVINGTHTVAMFIREPDPALAAVPARSRSLIRTSQLLPRRATAIGEAVAAAMDARLNAEFPSSAYTSAAIPQLGQHGLDVGPGYGSLA